MRYSLFHTRNMASVINVNYKHILYEFTAFPSNLPLNLQMRVCESSEYV